VLPLEGIKVLNFTQGAGGPFGAMMLGDMGADVIKIEPPTGDHFRPTLGGAWVVVVNRNKRSLVLNLKTKEAREIALKLAEKADILMEAFVPGVMDKLGLGYDTIKKINPGIIYCSVSGYGQDGPYRERAGYDIAAQCESGLLAATGEADRPPVRVGSSLIDYGTGMYGAYTIALALMHREKTGKGQYIDVSLFDTAVSWMNYWIAFYSLRGINPPRVGSGHALGAPYQVFDTKDLPVFIGVSTDKFWKDFCKILKLDNMVDDPRFATNEQRVKNKSELLPLIFEVLKQYSSKEIREKMESVGIPCARVQQVSDVIKDPHVIERKMVIEMDYAPTGRVKVPSIPYRMSETPGEIRCPAPVLGEHTFEVLKEIGYSEEELRQLQEKKIIMQHGA